MAGLSAVHQAQARNMDKAQPAEPTSQPPTPTSRKRSRSGTRKTSEATRSSEATVPTHPDPHLQQYIHRDQLYAVAEYEQEAAKKDLITQLQHEKRMWEEARKSNRLDPGWIYGKGFQGYGNGWTARHPKELAQIIYPSARKRPGRRGTKELRYNKKDRDAQKERSEDLVPIRLDLEVEKLRLRDTFTWNLHDRIVNPALFAQGMVEDFEIPEEHKRMFVDQVQQTMQEQINEFHPHPFIEDEPLDPHLPYSSYKNDDLRILVKLNITIGRHSLVDQFEWDINHPANSPEDFAQHMAADLCLSGEFMTAIAHQIREQTQAFTKSLYISGHPFDGRTVEEPDIRDNMAPSPLPASFRPYQAAREYAPFFYELNEADLERTEDAFQREQRQQKRSVNRKGGPTLPELKERLRTVRTMLVSSVVPGAADTVEDSGLYRPTRRTGRGRRNYRVDDDGSDLEVSEEDSDPDEPTAQAAIGRARRAAASNAQAAMRTAQAPQGSPTPEYQQPRPKRFGWDYENNPVSGEPGLIVKLKVPRMRFRELVRNQKRQAALRISQSREMLAQQYQQQQQQQQQQARRVGTPQAGAMPPPPTRGTPQAPLFRAPSSDPMSRVSNQDGANDTPPPLRATSTHHSGPQSQQPPSAPPPPPAWLTQALADLRKEHPNEDFQAAMRNNPTLSGHHEPRIKCNDCANNILYKTDEYEPVRNFRSHLANQAHLERVGEKMRRRRELG